MRLLVVVALLACCVPGRGVSPEWREVALVLTRQVRECWGKAAAVKGGPENHVTRVRLCLKMRAVRALDEVLRQDVIPLGEGMQLVRFNSSSAVNTTDTLRPERMVREDMAALVLERLSELLDTHVLHFSSDDHGRDHETEPGDIALQSGKGRIRRRHYRHMFPLMVVGFMTMASFLVPLGFQFMAMLGGKALLLSKIALMMSTFQGIKKVTSAGYNYGFYHVPPAVDLYHSHAAHHPEVWRRNSVPLGHAAGKSYAHRGTVSQPAEEEAGQQQAYQHVLAVLPTQAGNYQGSVAQPIPMDSNQHVLAVIPYLQNTDAN